MTQLQDTQPYKQTNKPTFPFNYTNVTRVSCLGDLFPLLYYLRSFTPPPSLFILSFIYLCWLWFFPFGPSLINLLPSHQPTSTLLFFPSSSLFLYPLLPSLIYWPLLLSFPLLSGLTPHSFSSFHLVASFYLISPSPLLFCFSSHRTFFTLFHVFRKEKRFKDLSEVNSSVLNGGS